MMNLQQKSYFVSCPKGLEILLKQELEELGASNTRATAAGVYFDGRIKTAYKVCLWSRLANKVLLPLDKGKVSSADDLYALVKKQPWETHLSVEGSLLVEFSGTNQSIRHTQFGAQAVKDAIVDRMREQMGDRPSVSKTAPDIRINARLAKDLLHLSLDLSGDSLHKRGYRVGPGGAPLKENLAAAILIRAEWPSIFEAGGALLDPMCGSGTFLIEGAMIALKMAPGLLRARSPAAERVNPVQESEERRVVGFGFDKWLQHDAVSWAALVEEAEEQFNEAKQRGLPEIRGYDISTRVLGNTRKNIAMAGLDDFIRVTAKEVADFTMPTHRILNQGLIVCNPPYGERLGEVEALRTTYYQLASACKASFDGWTLGVFTGNKELGRELRLRPKKKYQFYNGAIPSELLLFDISETGHIREYVPHVDEAQKTLGDEHQQTLYKQPLHRRPMSSGAEMVANRLRKNRKRLEKWANKRNIECYRLYDADMPEYAAAIDIYRSTNNETYLHVQEYAAPRSIDAEKASERFDDLIHACACVYDMDEQNIITKLRQRNKGKQQYEKLENHQASVRFSARESDALLEVNLTDYLDTGVFLDHRPLRKMIADQVVGKDFLNLFCYTATATVHAALAGARASVSVDLSNTYLDWAKRNFELNNIHPSSHKLIRDNCLDWLRNCRQGFDVIMLDPPSFSNSKRMDNILDVQKDHAAMITRCMDILKPGGVLYFSNNLRSFKLDEAKLNRYTVRNITANTLDEDFGKNSKIHQCWMIQG